MRKIDGLEFAMVLNSRQRIRTSIIIYIVLRDMRDESMYLHSFLNTHVKLRKNNKLKYQQLS